MCLPIQPVSMGTVWQLPARPGCFSLGARSAPGCSESVLAPPAMSCHIARCPLCGWAEGHPALTPSCHLPGLYEGFEGLQAEECGILNGCENGRCVRVREGYTCDCFDGFQLDMTRMACVGEWWPRATPGTAGGCSRGCAGSLVPASIPWRLPLSGGAGRDSCWRSPCSPWCFCPTELG